MSQLNYYSYSMGCTCPDCLKVKNSLIAEMNFPAPVAKPWSEFLYSPGYSTYNQYQVVDPKEFYKQLVTTNFAPPPVREDKTSQEEVNAKWRPWFDALTLTQRKILEKNFPSTLPVSGEFPEEMGENWWLAVESHLDNPYNHVMYMISQIPVFYTEVTLPCEGCCGSYTEAPLYSVVMHMNDMHNWSFNDIANWLDTLGLDLSFPIPEEITEH